MTTARKELWERVQGVHRGIFPAACILLLLIAPVPAADYTVAPSGGNFSSIQEAVVHARSGDTILVWSGRYNETLRIDKTLVIRGLDTGKGLPVIEPDTRGDAVEISADGCSFSGFVIRNARLLSGIRLTSDRNTVNGIRIIGCSQGILLAKADNNILSDNNVTQNTRSGIALEGSSSNRIEGNTFTGNSIGITLDEYSTSNRIALNNFDNKINVASKSATSLWITENPLRYQYLGIDRTSRLGNYWSDYGGTDPEGDGIGDIPYVIQIGANKKAVLPVNQNTADTFPLMDPFEYYKGRVKVSPDTPATVKKNVTVGVAAVQDGSAAPGPAATVSGPANPFKRLADALPVPVLLLSALILAGAGTFLIYRRRQEAPPARGAPVPLPGGDGAVQNAGASPGEPLANLGDTTVPATGTKAAMDQEAVPEPPVPQTYFPRELDGRYSDARLIGRGGIAWVYTANRRADGKKVAIKIPISFDEMTGKCFLNEIQAWETLRHRNIVEVTAVNILPVPYVEMEYVPGTLEAVAKPLPVWKAVYIIRSIADALSYAHSKNIIHRDIKPHNILVTDDLTPKITDWGMSKVLAADSRKSSIAGFSLSYAAPEQVSPSEYGRTDVRTDIYQLGTLFYELVTGSLPFGGESIVTVGNAILREAPVPPSEYNPEAAAVDRIILKCLEKDPAKRYQTAEELKAALAGYLDEEP